MMKKNIHKNTQMMAVIKMDGYGHGAVQIAKLLEPMDYIWGYAVATLDEAILIKDACLKKPVLVLGCIFPDQWDVMIRNEIRMTVYSYEMAKELVKRGWYIGFTGVVTFKNARKAVEVAQNIPLDRVLIETDCPYMAPEPFRGRRCDPSLVPYVAKKIADLRGLSPESVAAATAENAKRCFRI